MIFLVVPLVLFIVAIWDYRRWGWETDEVSGICMTFGIIVSILWLLVAAIISRNIVCEEICVEYYSHEIEKYSTQLANDCTELWNKESKAFLYGLSGRRDFSKLLEYQNKIYDAKVMRVKSLSNLKIYQRLRWVYPRLVLIDKRFKREVNSKVSAFRKWCDDYTRKTMEQDESIEENNEDNE